MSLPLFVMDKLARMQKRKDRKKLKRDKKPTRAQMVKKADAIFGRIVRSVGYCQSGRDSHAGALQCAHGFSRRYHVTRWNSENAWCLCQGCHLFFTMRPEEWQMWMESALGDRYYELRDEAIHGDKPDMAVILSALEGMEA